MCPFRLYTPVLFFGPHNTFVGPKLTPCNMLAHYTVRPSLNRELGITPASNVLMWPQYWAKALDLIPNVEGPRTW